VPSNWVSEKECKFEFQPRLLRETTVDVLVHLRNLVRRIDNNGSGLALLDSSEARHDV
jgi:hypothetical protein